MTRLADTQVLYHDLATNGVLYLDLAFDLHVFLACRPPAVCPAVRESASRNGRRPQGFVRTLSAGRTHDWRNSAKGLDLGHPELQFAAARLFLRAKAVPEKGTELLTILRDVLLEAHLNNQERLKQLVLEEKASRSPSLVSGGSHFVDMRIRANFHEANWAEEQIGTEKVEALILETLRALADKGIDRMTVEASLNTVEFRLVRTISAPSRVASRRCCARSKPGSTIATRWRRWRSRRRRQLSVVPA